MYRFNNGVLTCYYTEITSRVMKAFAEVRKNNYNKPYVQCSSLLEAADDMTIYYTALTDYEKLIPVKEAIDSMEDADCAFYKDTYTGKWFLEAFSAKASKSNGIRFLRERYGFDEVVAFGDNLNDLPMFEIADEAYAMSNALDEVKAAATGILGSNNEDSVARFIAQDNH